MSEKTFTPAEARQLAIDAAQEALARFAASHPLPSCVTIDEAARMLGVSRRTAYRLKLPRNSTGRVPYEAVLAARASR